MSGSVSLEGKTALVTGGAKRIGRAIALALAEAGARVVVHYNRAAKEAGLLCEEMNARGCQTWSIAADLESPEEAERLLPRVIAEAGPVDVLVNNASIFPEDTVNDFTAQDLALNVQVNAMAPLLLSRAFAAQKRGGHIVNLLDARIQDYDRLHAAYHLSKRMLMSLTSMLALEYAPSIRVNGVAPGLILAPEGKDPGYLERLASTNPLNAYGAPEDIAEAVLFLLASRFITGQIIYVDGGRHLKGRVYG